MRRALIPFAAAAALSLPIALWAGGEQCKSGASCSDKTSMVSTGDQKCTEAAGAKSGACCEAKDGATLVSTGATAPLEVVKSLAGKWKMAAGEKHHDGFSDIEFKTSSAGSVVVETMFPGQPHEMTNVYAMDGDRLLVTHYCAAGNQPRMQLVSSENNVLKFDFMDATNLPDKNKMYMGRLELTVLGPDKIQEKWTSFNNGKEESEHAMFTLERVK